MSFGFSVGDFISALELVGIVINALRECSGSRSEYRELVNQLYSLETALLQVKQLELDEEQRSEYIALRQSASQCQRTIDSFWKKIKKYQKHLRTNGSSSKLKDGWIKVRWAMCEREDLARFKADLAAHTQSINIIMAALQVNNLKNQDRKRNAEYRSISSTIQDATFNWMAKLVEITTSITSGVVQGQEILQNTARILATNIRIFQVVCCIQNIITRIPNQVDRQQPVYMVDALGKNAPFYLEFIRSKEALHAVLKINFEKIPSGPRKIDNGEFVILEAASKRQIDLSTDWDACFMPGQRIEMRMIFQRQTRRLNSCPSCGYESEIYAEGDVDCIKCGVTFRRIIQIEEPPTDPKAEPRKKGVKDLRELASALSYDVKTSEILEPSRPPKTAYDEVEDLKYYRRINVVQRQRRAVWDSDIVPVSSGLYVKNHDGEQPVERYYGEDLSDNSDTEGIATLGDFVDADTFEQILEMDDSDDEIEREFSRGLILGVLEGMEVSIRRIQDTLRTNSGGVSRVASGAHALKGQAGSIGALKVRQHAFDIHGIALDESQSIDGKCRDIEQLMSGMKEAFVNTQREYRSFYREEQVEVEW